MRVPTLQTARSQLETLSARQAEQAKLQSQVASGLRVQSPGDDPVAAAQAELARSRLARLAQDQRATQLSTGILNAADGALAQGTDLLQNARDALVAAGNGGYTASDRQALAQQLRATRADLLAIANTPDGAGGYVFSGQGGGAPPFAGTTPTAAPDAGTQRIGDGGRYAASVDGQAAFLAVPRGNGVFVTAAASGNSGGGWIAPGTVSDATQLTGHAYRIAIAGSAGALTYSVTDTTTGGSLAADVPFVAGAAIDVAGQRVTVAGTPAAGDAFGIAPAGRQSVFATLDDAIALLENETLPPGAYAEGLERVQAGVDRGLDALALARTQAGAELQRVEDAQAGDEQQQLATTARRSDLQDLDMARGISDLQNGQVALNAALQSYAAIGRKTLFDVLS